MDRKDIDNITDAFMADGCDSSAFESLGDLLFDTNVNKAFLCYEMAAFYSQKDVGPIELGEKIKRCGEKDEFCVRPVSVVILSYNNMNLTVECIESVRKNNPPRSYELVVVDNASSDGVVEWLKAQEDIVLTLNSENKGFAFGCNQGVESASDGNDILFLNNDTLVCPNSIFWLRMGLYEDAKVGAVGSVSNDVGNQQRVKEQYESTREWLDFGRRNNVFREYPYEEKIYLVGFAMMVKRKVLDEVGLFDTLYGVGNFEDNDLGIRILDAGYRLLLCCNSFIFHYGRMGFKLEPTARYDDLMSKNYNLFKQKWGFDGWSNSYPDEELIDLIDEEDRMKEIRVLEIGCGMGSNLTRIKTIYPKAVTFGMDDNESVVKIAGKTRNIIKADYDNFDVSEMDGEFDYIIIGEVTSKIWDIKSVIEKLKPLLALDGSLLCSFSNIMHGSVLIPMLKGEFEYSDLGIIKKDVKRYYTLKNVFKLLIGCGFQIKRIEGIQGDKDIFESESALWNYLKDGLGDDFEQQCLSERYIVKGTSRL